MHVKFVIFVTGKIFLAIKFRSLHQPDQPEGEQLDSWSFCSSEVPHTGVEGMNFAKCMKVTGLFFLRIRVIGLAQIETFKISRKR